MKTKPIDEHLKHEEYNPNCPQCQKERDEAIAKRNAVKSAYAGPKR